MNIGDFEVFTAVAKEQSFIKAARLMYISQSAVSQRIRKMEQELGFPLFTRNGHDVRLTEKGKIMLDAAGTILECWSSALSACGGGGTENRKLRVSYVGSKNFSDLPEILEAFGARQPLYEVVVSRIFPDQALPTLENHLADLVITPAYALLGTAGIRTVPLYTDMHYCVMNVENPLSGRASLTFSDLTGKEVLAPAGSACPEHMKPVIEELRKASYGCRIRDGHSADNVQIRLVSDKDSIALMPGYTVSVHPKLTAVLFRDGAAIPVVCASLKDLTEPELEFAEVARSKFGQPAGM